MGDRSCAAIVSDDSILMVRQTYKGETFWTFLGGRIPSLRTSILRFLRQKWYVL